MHTLSCFSALALALALCQSPAAQSPPPPCQQATVAFCAAQNRMPCTEDELCGQCIEGFEGESGTNTKCNPQSGPSIETVDGNIVIRVAEGQAVHLQIGDQAPVSLATLVAEVAQLKMESSMYKTAIADLQDASQFSTRVAAVLEEGNGVNDQLGGLSSDIGKLQDDTAMSKAAIADLQDASLFSTRVAAVLEEDNGVNDQLGGLSSDIANLQDDTKFTTRVESVLDTEGISEKLQAIAPLVPVNGRIPFFGGAAFTTIKYSSTKQLAANTWTTIFSGNDKVLDTGSFIFHFGPFTTAREGGGDTWSEYFVSSPFAFYTGPANDQGDQEIELITVHNTGHANNSERMSWRVIRQSGNQPVLFQMMTNDAWARPLTIEYNFLKLF